MQTRPAQTRLRGHALRDGGAPFAIDGDHARPDTGRGHAMCSCGTISGVLPSDSARREWHEGHKSAVAVYERRSPALCA